MEDHNEILTASEAEARLRINGWWKWYFEAETAKYQAEIQQLKQKIKELEACQKQQNN